MTITDAKAAELRALCEAANLFWDEPQTIGKNEVMRALLHTALTAIPALLDELDELIKERDHFRKLDSEAATYVESVICMRTGFSGEPPYVGWKGLGLALNEALDERDAALSREKVLLEALEVACRRGCNHCADDIREARRINNAHCA